MKLMTEKDLSLCIGKIGLLEMLRELISRLRIDYARWDEFTKVARHATCVANGVIELMPIADKKYYACKYVNGHPNNPQQGKATVIGLGLLADVDSGYPLLISEMTVLTAMRTAAMSACVAQFMVHPQASTLAIIGCGAQSEFQVLAHLAVFPLARVSYFDCDQKAMEKFQRNMQPHGLELVACSDAQSCVKDADIVITATTVLQKKPILEASWLMPQAHVHAIGGDCPGKNELTLSLLQSAQIVVVELLEQTQHEGEIEQLSQNKQAELVVPFAQLAGHGAPDDDKFADYKQQLTVFDSTGFALEDYTTLVYIYECMLQYSIGAECGLVPELADPKNLFASIDQSAK